MSKSTKVNFSNLQAGRTPKQLRLDEIMFRTTLRQLSVNLSLVQIHSLPLVLRSHPNKFARYISTTCHCRFIDGTPTTTPRTSLLPEESDPDDLSNPGVYLEDGNKIGGKTITQQDALQMLSDELFIGRTTGERILKKDSKLRLLNGTNFKKILQLLNDYKISVETIEEFPWILTITSYNLRTKLETIAEMKPKDINDFVPLLRTSNFRLTKILCIMEAESDLIPGGNRIYYLADRLGLPPKTVCKYLSRRLFMLELPAKTIMGILEAMLHYGIAPESIIRDLWAFRYNAKSIVERLERAKRAHKEKIMPWMIRCPERILERCLRLAVDEKRVLGKNEGVYEYLSQRLGYDIEITKAIVAKHPAVAKIRVTKIKEILDYLLNEYGATKQDIAQVPRILSHGLTTTKARLEELKSYGCTPSSLVVVCKSKREYNKFLNSWLENRTKMQNEKAI